MFLFLTSLCEASEKTKKYNLFFMYFWVVVFTLFRGLRWCTGTDWAQYQACFDRANWENIFTYYRYGLYSEVMEYGYVFLNVLIKTIFGKYTCFLLLINLAILLNFAYFSKKYVPKYPLLTFSLLVVYNPIFPVRQDIAMILLFWACHFSICKKYLLTLVFVFLASTIHDMSVIFFPLCLIFTLDIKLKYLLVATIISSIFLKVETFLNIFDILGGVSLGAISEMSTLYLENVTSEPTKMSIFRYIYVIGFVITFKYYYNTRGKISLRISNLLASFTNKKVFSSNSELIDLKLRTLNFYTNAYVCMFLVYILSGMGGPMVGFGRIAHFFYPSFPIAFMIIFSLEFSPKHQRVLFGIYVTFFLYQFFRFQIIDLFSLYDEYLNPYYTIFDTVPVKRVEIW